MEAARIKLMLFFISAVAVAVAAAGAEKDDGIIYLVHMNKSQKPAVFLTHEHWYQSIVSSIVTSRSRVERADEGFTLLYVYDHVMHGFSAKLTQSEVDVLQTIPGHLASYPDTTGKWHTTHSFEILGLKPKSGIWPLSEFGNRSDVIIGILDSGIWPESESFRDEGMSDVPARWKGQCQEGEAFNSSLCNRKLIGARYFNKGYMAFLGNFAPYNVKDYNSPRDYFGHGSHTSSTAAGNYVSNVDYFGYAKGTARGMAPRARVAMYKVGWSGGITGCDILAGMEHAISDGVDVMSLSIELSNEDFSTNAIAIGAFAAAEKGVFVACSAGNDGPDMFTVGNGAPWILTVGASTIDRALVAKVKLGNGKVMQGTSLFVESQVISGVPLIYGTHGNKSSLACAPDSLDPKTVAGNILLCINHNNNNNSMQVDPATQISEANRTGAAAVIIAYEDYDSLYPHNYWMPAVLVSSDQGQLIANYYLSSHTSNLIAFADLKFVITEVGTSPAPTVAFFSSRGPNLLSPGILKPDVIAPGDNIVAAWLPYDGVAQVGSVPLETDYAMVSGTSMASPHAVGVAALVKAVHPNWSPAAIRSALMTTADTLDNTGYTIKDEAHPRFGHGATPLDFGAGHLNANKAADPGLVYDSGVKDYLDYLCALNYTEKEIRIITRRESSCTRHTVVGDLNYPSFLADFTTSSEKQVKTFNRILTNVGDYRNKNKRSYVYRAVVKAPQGVVVHVEPETLVFSERNQKLGFRLIMEVDETAIAASTSKCAAQYTREYCLKVGYLSWVDGRDHVVTSPLVATFGLS